MSISVSRGIENAKRLFLQLSDKFELDFDSFQKTYHLKTKNSNKCHPLETCLLGHENMTGYKIIDIKNQINKNPRWILGFFHGFMKITPKFKNSEYLDGYQNAKSIN